MAPEAEEMHDGPAADPSDGRSQKKLSSKKLILFIILPLLLLGGGGAGLYFSGMLDKFLKKGGEAGEHADATAGEEATADATTGAASHTAPGHFYSFPDVIVNLSDEGKKQRFLKLTIAIELPTAEDIKAFEAVMPRVKDYFQTYLRELRVEDLRGSAGVYRLRQELLERVRTAAHPIEVRDILFSEILVQ
jgi:flagellar FliL protein